MVVRSIQGLYAEGLAAQRTAFWTLMRHIKSQEREIAKLRARVRRLEKRRAKAPARKPAKKSTTKRRRS